MKSFLYLLPFAMASTAFAAEPTQAGTATLDLGKVFAGSPTIYTILLIMSVGSFVTWIYSLLTLKKSEMIPEAFVNTLREQIAQKRFEAALKTCEEGDNFSSKIIATGLSSRRHGSQVMMESMQAEGRRSAMNLWQRVSLLSDVVIVAPMFGLLGTVLGMFFAFYDADRTMESLTQIFDGLGIAIGTTVAGLIVAILAMVFQTTLKMHITRLMNTVENEARSLVNMVENEAGV